MDSMALPCVAHVWTPTAQEADKLRAALKPLLQNLGSEFKAISISDYNSASKRMDSETILSHIQKNEEEMVRQLARSQSNKLTAPSVAVVLMLKETHPFQGYDEFKRVFNHSPWKFHHKIEVSNTEGQRIRSLARQEFYQPGPGLPLWAVCPVHFGQQQLRFTIFTRNFSAMMDFYRILTGQEVEYAKANFCLFELYSAQGTGVQLALKHCPQIHPVPSRTATLTFRVRSTDYLHTLLDVNLTPITASLFTMQDPDGNCVLVEQVIFASATHQRLIHQPHKTTTGHAPCHLDGTFKRWSETSSFDSGKHSSSFNSVLDSALSEDVDSCISEAESSDLDSPLWPHSYKLAPSLQHTVVQLKTRTTNTNLNQYHTSAPMSPVAASNVSSKRHQCLGHNPVCSNGLSRDNVTCSGLPKPLVKSLEPKGCVVTRQNTGNQHQWGRTSMCNNETWAGSVRSKRNAPEKRVKIEKAASSSLKPWELNRQQENWLETLTTTSFDFS